MELVVNSSFVHVDWPEFLSRWVKRPVTLSAETLTSFSPIEMSKGDDLECRRKRIRSS